MIIKKVKIPIYEQTLYVSITEDYSKDEEEYECIWRPGKEDFSGLQNKVIKYTKIMRKELRKYIASQMLLWTYYILPECTFKMAYSNFIKKYIHLL